MFIPTDYVLKQNVLSYNINTGRIFFEKAFWSNYSAQLIQDFVHETGIALENKSRFFSEIKRSLFEYYYYTIMRKQPMNTSLYQQITTIFQKHSGNGFPKLITDFKKEVPVYYDDDHKIEDPVDISFTTTSHHRQSESVSIVSVSEQLQEIESTYAHQFERNYALGQEFDQYLKQYMCHDDAVINLKQDYQEGKLTAYVDKMNDSVAIKFDDCMDVAVRIYNHYDHEVGIPTIFNNFTFEDVNVRQSILKAPTRFDLWNRNFNSYKIYKSLTSYLGLDICEHLYDSFIRSGYFHYRNGYEYVFCCFLARDFYNRLKLKRENVKAKGFIPISKHMKENKQKRNNIFTASDSTSFLKSSLVNKSSDSKQLSLEKSFSRLQSSDSEENFSGSTNPFMRNQGKKDGNRGFRSFNN